MVWCSITFRGFKCGGFSLFGSCLNVRLGWFVVGVGFRGFWFAFWCVVLLLTFIGFAL